MAAEKAPIGQAWADKYPERFFDPDPPQPTPCPVCGDPTGNCVPEENIHMAEPIIVPHPARRTNAPTTPSAPGVINVPAPLPRPITQPDRRKPTRRPQEPTVDVPEHFALKAGSENIIVAQATVTAEFRRGGASRVTRQQLFTKGEEITVVEYARRVERVEGATITTT